MANLANAISAEIVQRADSFVARSELEEALRRFLGGLTEDGLRRLPFETVMPSATAFPSDDEDGRLLRENCETLTIEGRPGGGLFVYAYRLDEDGEGDGGDDGDEDGPSTRREALPSRRLHGLWESLVFEGRVKEELLAIASTAALFAARGVDPLLIERGGSVLLHGPPGTGKTQLCRALAQRLAVRLARRYPRSVLVEVDAHGLFSKWFSESGKLVARLFAEISELAADPDRLVCVVIDEVESLCRTRAACLGGAEPSDAIRAVNAVLTELDRLKRRPNAIVLTTSNMTAAIDRAFVDRADLKRHIGPPPIGAVRRIYRSCLDELIRTGTIEDDVREPETEPFRELCERSVGLSGRTLRKIPFLAHANHLRSSPVSLPVFLEAMKDALETHKLESEHLTDNFKNIHL